MTKFLHFIIIVVFIGTLIFLVRIGEVSDLSKYVIFDDIKVKVEIVDTYDTRELGLSGRESLLPNTGMLFVFDSPGLYSFWMKDMHFAIDIIWLGENKEIVYLKENARPESFPESFDAEQNSLYVLEVPAGFIKEHNLHVGDEAEFDF